MFRNLSEDRGGFVNEGLEISDEYGKGQSTKHFSFDNPSTKIEITRSKYNQQRLHDEMKYKQPLSKSGKFCFSLSIYLYRHGSHNEQLVSNILNLSSRARLSSKNTLSIKGARTTVSLNTFFLFHQLYAFENI